MNTDAGTIELHFLDGDFVMNKDLYDQIVYLFMNPQIIYSFISKYNNEIMWEWHCLVKLFSFYFL